MPDLVKNIIRGAGTLLDVAPAPTRRFNDWKIIGDHLRSAITRAGVKKAPNGTAQ
jgi:hypothetical protein